MRGEIERVAPALSILPARAGNILYNPRFDQGLRGWGTATSGGSIATYTSPALYSKSIRCVATSGYAYIAQPIYQGADGIGLKLQGGVRVAALALVYISAYTSGSINIRVSCTYTDTTSETSTGYAVTSLTGQWQVIGACLALDPAKVPQTIRVIVGHGIATTGTATVYIGECMAFPAGTAPSVYIPYPDTASWGYPGYDPVNPGSGTTNYTISLTSLSWPADPKDAPALHLVMFSKSNDSPTTDLYAGVRHTTSSSYYRLLNYQQVANRWMFSSGIYPVPFRQRSIVLTATMGANGGSVYLRQPGVFY